MSQPCTSILYLRQGKHKRKGQHTWLLYSHSSRSSTEGRKFRRFLVTSPTLSSGLYEKSWLGAKISTVGAQRSRGNLTLKGRKHEKVYRSDLPFWLPMGPGASNHLEGCRSPLSSNSVLISPQAKELCSVHAQNRRSGSRLKQRGKPLSRRRY